MDNATRKNLEGWLRRQLYGSMEENGRCVKFQIAHLAPSSKKGSDVGVVKIPPDGIPPEDLDALITQIETICYEDAGGLEGTQRYVLFPYFKDAQKTIGRFVLRIEGDANDDDELASEPATKTGLLAQLMRHQEAIMRTSMLGIQNVVQMQQRVISRLSEQNEAMLGKHVENINSLEDLRNEKHERDLKSEEARFRQKSMQDIVDKVMLLLPNVVNKLGGKGQKLLPEKSTTTEAGIYSLLSSITPDQLATLSGVLKPEQLATLQNVYESTREKFEAEKKEKEGQQ